MIRIIKIWIIARQLDKQIKMKEKIDVMDNSVAGPDFIKSCFKSRYYPKSQAIPLINSAVSKKLIKVEAVYINIGKGESVQYISLTEEGRDFTSILALFQKILSDFNLFWTLVLPVLVALIIGAFSSQYIKIPVNLFLKLLSIDVTHF